MEKAAQVARVAVGGMKKDMRERKNEEKPRAATAFLGRRGWINPSPEARRRLMAANSLPQQLWCAFDLYHRRRNIFAELKTLPPPWTVTGLLQMPFFGPYDSEIELSRLLGDRHVLLLCWMTTEEVLLVKELPGEAFINMTEVFGRVQYQVTVLAEFRPAMEAAKTIYAAPATNQRTGHMVGRRGA